MGTYRRSCKERIVKKQKKTGRRFVQRVKGKTVPGLQIEIPDALKGTPRHPKPDTAAICVCPVCHAVRYVSQALLHHLPDVHQPPATPLPGPEHSDLADNPKATPTHPPC